MSTSTRESVWITPGEAAEMTGLNRKQISRLADEGLVGRRNLPGVRPCYRRADIEALGRNGLLEPAETSTAATP
jgi:hypothetical protein